MAPPYRSPPSTQHEQSAVMGRALPQLLTLPNGVVTL